MSFCEVILTDQKLSAVSIPAKKDMHIYTKCMIQKGFELMDYAAAIQYT